MGEISINEIDKKYERMNSLYYIVNEDTQSVLFKFRPAQEILYKGLHDQNIILKSRQPGITSFFCILGLDTAIHNQNVSVGIIAHTRYDAESFFKNKIKFAWDKLDPVYKKKLGIEAKQDSARELIFSNNSSIRVGTSLRSATLNVLHISEFAKVCARSPEKAREIVTGALNTVHEGALVSIESTAEGRDGYFYDYCQEAQKAQKSKKELTRLDFKFFFFPWWQDKKNTLHGEEVDQVVITERMEKYFSELQAKIEQILTAGQKAWYIKKEKTMGADMKREHPSTADESFEVSVEGAYFATQFNKIYKEDRITTVHYEPGYPVHTAWDLGISDTMPIWFYQIIGNEVRVIDYYENSGEGFAHYADILREKPYKYGNHYAPHDIKVRELSTGISRKETAFKMGINFTETPSLPKPDQIEAARNLLNKSWFDEKKCSDGVIALENYKKDWDEKFGCWKQTPRHDWASHPSDAFMIAALSTPFKETETSPAVQNLINKNRRMKGLRRR